MLLAPTRRPLSQQSRFPAAGLASQHERFAGGGKVSIQALEKVFTSHKRQAAALRAGLVPRGLLVERGRHLRYRIQLIDDDLEVSQHLFAQRFGVRVVLPRWIVELT